MAVSPFISVLASHGIGHGLLGMLPDSVSLGPLSHEALLFSSLRRHRVPPLLVLLTNPHEHVQHARRLRQPLPQQLAADHRTGVADAAPTVNRGAASASQTEAITEGTGLPKYACG